MKTPATPLDPQGAPPPDVQLKQTWERYGNLIYLVIGAIALAILAKGGLDYLNAQKEIGIQTEFEQCVSMDSFKAFASNHPGHVLTGVAELTIADNAYSAGKYPEALAQYTAAVADLPAGPAQARAKLGRAMSLEFTGKGADAEASLRQMLNDTSLLKTIRCEAGLHLAGLAAAAGRGNEVQALAEQLMQIDPQSPFSERAFSLRPPVEEAIKVPSVSLKPGLPAPAKP